FANDVNDLYQLDRYGVRSPLFALAALDGSPTRRWWKRAADGVFPNLYALAGRAAARLAPARAHAAGPAVGTPSMRDPEATLRALGARYGRADAVVARYRDLCDDDRAAVDRLLGGAPLGEDVRPALLLSALVDPETE